MKEMSDTSQELSEMVFTPKQKPSWIVVGIMITLGVLAGIFLFQANNGAPEQVGREDIISEKFEQGVSPTPMPFAEITIPFLRERTYQSTVGERTLQYQNSSYTAYLSSYESDGLQVNALLTIPNGDIPEGGFPAIVFLHGYIPPSQYQTVERYYDHVDYLARSGFVVLKTDLRGHGNSEGIAGGGYYSADYVIDTLNARAALQENEYVNPDRIGLWGHSMAGNVVMRTMAVRPEIPATVIWAGAVYTYEDMQKYSISDSSYQRPPEDSQRIQDRQKMRDIHGQPDLSEPFWQQVAPITYISDLKGAVQLNHAVDDAVVDIGYSRDLVEYLEEANIPYELNEYPSGGHNITGVSFNNAMANTVAFFTKHLN